MPRRRRRRWRRRSSRPDSCSVPQFNLTTISTWAVTCHLLQYVRVHKDNNSRDNDNRDSGKMKDKDNHLNLDRQLFQHAAFATSLTLKCKVSLYIHPRSFEGSTRISGRIIWGGSTHHSTHKVHAVNMISGFPGSLRKENS